MKTENNDVLNKLKDFRSFLCYMWKVQGLPSPTPLQLSIAKTLQDAPYRLILEAFRGIGKSYILMSYVLWRLLFNRDLKALVVSASAQLSSRFTTQCLNLIRSADLLKHLHPTTDQRSSSEGFDVAGCKPTPTPSVYSIGITGQLTGNRADLIIADDIEVPGNSSTYDMREKLLERTSEFAAVAKTGSNSQIIYLGTPQCEDSIYRHLYTDRGYEVRVYPALMPTEKQKMMYGETLSPYITSLTFAEGEPTDPERFDRAEIEKKRQEYRMQGFALQFMLDTSLSDGDKTPLKLHDLIVTDIHDTQAPDGGYVWTNDKQFIAEKDIPCVGLTDDRYFRPSRSLGDFVDFQGCTMAIDPAGRGSQGSDEMAYAVTKFLNGYIYLVDIGGIFGNGQEQAEQLADIAKKHKVSKVLVERNFGDGAFTQLLKPILWRKQACFVEEPNARNTVNKERRIIDILSPILGRHKLVVSPTVIKQDKWITEHRSMNTELCYSLFYQLARITNEKGCLKHDDRVDALALSCSSWIDQLNIDEKLSIKARKESERIEWLEKYIDHVESLDNNESWDEHREVNLITPDTISGDISSDDDLVNDLIEQYTKNKS